MIERIQNMLINLLLEPTFLKGLGKCCMWFSLFTSGIGAIDLTFRDIIDNLYNRPLSLTNGNAVVSQPLSLFEQWPLINALIPETAGAFSLYAALFTFGLMLVYVGKQIDHAH